MAANKIKGKIARVLNSREIAINIGLDAGVRSGMLFDVLDPKGEDISDPETGEVLGSVDRPKVRVKITDVKEKLSIASTYRSSKINVGGQGNYGSIAEMFMAPKYITRFETFKTKEKTWEDLDESESYVKVGDPVVQVKEVEELASPEE